MERITGYVEGRYFVWSDSNCCTRCNREMYKPGKREEGKIRYHAKGLCNPCYAAVRLGTSPRQYIHFDESGQTCSKCSIYQPYEQYTIKKVKTRSGYHSWCKTCQVMYKYNITKVEYDSMFSSQDGLCAICQNPPTEDGKALDVDHDHNCCPSNTSCGSCIRGLLCDNCNKGIGLLGDNPDTLLAAHNYLKESILVKSN